MSNAHELKGLTRAVLTGDIVGSTELDGQHRAALSSYLFDAWEEARRIWGSEALQTPPDVFRGDSWQVIVESAPHSLRVALYLRCRLRVAAPPRPSLRTRISVGIGNVDFRPTDRQMSGGGSAFIISGKLLDNMPRDRWLAIGVADTAPHIASSATRAVAALLDTIAGAWTENQSQAVAGRLAGLKQKDIAAMWAQGPTSQQAVATHLRRADWDAIEESLGAFAEIFE